MSRVVPAAPGADGDVERDGEVGRPTHLGADDLDNVEMVADPVFNVEVPVAVPDVPSDVLRPRNTWKDPKAYDKKAAELARMFEENFDKYRSSVPREVAAAGPTLG